MSTDPLLLAALGDLSEAVRSLRAEVARIGASGADTAPAAPIFVVDAAALLGVSREHVDRTIKALPDDRRPPFVPTVRATPGRRPKRRYYWPDRAALLTWWAAACAPAVAPSSGQPSRPTTRAPASGPALTDWRTLAGRGR